MKQVELLELFQLWLMAFQMETMKHQDGNSTNCAGSGEGLTEGQFRGG